MSEKKLLVPKEEWLVWTNADLLKRAENVWELPKEAVQKLEGQWKGTSINLSETYLNAWFKRRIGDEATADYWGNISTDMENNLVGHKMFKGQQAPPANGDVTVTLVALKAMMEENRERTERAMEENRERTERAMEENRERTVTEVIQQVERRLTPNKKNPSLTVSGIGELLRKYSRVSWSMRKSELLQLPAIDAEEAKYQDYYRQRLHKAFQKHPYLQPIDSHKVQWLLLNRSSCAKVAKKPDFFVCIRGCYVPKGECNAETMPCGAYDALVHMPREVAVLEVKKLSTDAQVSEDTDTASLQGLGETGEYMNILFGFQEAVYRGVALFPRQYVLASMYNRSSWKSTQGAVTDDDAFTKIRQHIEIQFKDSPVYQALAKVLQQFVMKTCDSHAFLGKGAHGYVFKVCNSEDCKNDSHGSLERKTEDVYALKIVCDEGGRGAERAVRLEEEYSLLERLKDVSCVVNAKKFWADKDSEGKITCAGLLLFPVGQQVSIKEVREGIGSLVKRAIVPLHLSNAVHGDLRVSNILKLSSVDGAFSWMLCDLLKSPAFTQTAMRADFQMLISDSTGSAVEDIDEEVVNAVERYSKAVLAVKPQGKMSFAESEVVTDLCSALEAYVKD